MDYFFNLLYYLYHPKYPIHSQQSTVRVRDVRRYLLDLNMRHLIILITYLHSLQWFFLPCVFCKYLLFLVMQQKNATSFIEKTDGLMIYFLGLASKILILRSKYPLHKDKWTKCRFLKKKSLVLYSLFLKKDDSRILSIDFFNKQH